MLTAVDHLVIGVVDLAEAVRAYRKLGFAVRLAPDEASGGGQAAYAMFGDFYVEFRQTDDLPRSGSGTDELERFQGIVFRTSDIDAEVTRLQSRGFNVSDPAPMSGPDSSQPVRTAFVRSSTPIGLVEQRRQTSGLPAAADGLPAHPNTATVLERIYIAVESIDRDIQVFEHLLGMRSPEPEMGTVIMSLMSVFYVGDIGIAVAEPRGPGPTAAALNAGGPGLFQLLFRADHLDTAAELMVANGLPPPTRGTRLSGESALLVEPGHTGTLYLALAGRP